jgi:hypothetical protein
MLRCAWMPPRRSVPRRSLADRLVVDRRSSVCASFLRPIASVGGPPSQGIDPSQSSDWWLSSEESAPVRLVAYVVKRAKNRISPVWPRINVTVKVHMPRRPFTRQRRVVPAAFFFSPRVSIASPISPVSRRAARYISSWGLSPWSG